MTVTASRVEGYREGGIGAESVLGLSITGSVPKSQTVHTQRGREKERGREGASQRSSSHKSKWRFATFKDTLKWSVAHVAMVHMYLVCVCGVCGICTWHLICHTRVARESCGRRERGVELGMIKR